MLMVIDRDCTESGTQPVPASANGQKIGKSCGTRSFPSGTTRPTVAPLR